MNNFYKLSIYIFLIVVLFFSINYFDNSIEINNSINKSFNLTKKLNYESMISIIKKDNDILNMIINGAKIEPYTIVKKTERERLPAIYNGLPKKLYQTKLNYGNIKLMIIFDKKKVYKKVNLMKMKI